MIPHGAFTHLLDVPDAAALPAELAAVDKPVVLLFGLMRPYKGIDVAIDAWRGIDDAELWIVGMPRMDTTALKAGAPPGVRFVERFVTDREIPALMRRADVVVLPYREIDQSGVLFTALAFGKPLVLSDVGGFPEVAATGAARLVPAGDPGALRTELVALLADPEARAAARRARRAARPASTSAGPRSRRRTCGCTSASPDDLARLAESMSALKTAFWVSAGLLVYTQVGYPLVLAAVDRVRSRRAAPVAAGPQPNRTRTSRW